MSRVLLLAACTLQVGCSPRDTLIMGEPLFSAGLGDRSVRETAYDVGWVFADDTVLVGPDRMAPAPGGGVYVLDLRAQQVHRIDSTGLLWSWGQTGEGPHELGSVRAMASDPATGGVILADSGRQRLLWLSPNGVVLHAAPVPMEDAGLIWSIVALADSSGYVLSTSTSDAPVLLVSADGSKGRPIPAPWDGFHRLSHLQWKGTVFAAPNGGWGYAFESGNGWFVFGSDSVSAYPYVEHTDFPDVVTEYIGASRSTRVISSPPYSGYDVASRGDTLYVLSGGKTEDAFRVLDKYSIGSGEYLGSQRLPGNRSYRRFAVDGVSVFLIDRPALMSVIVSFHERKTEP